MAIINNILKNFNLKLVKLTKEGIQKTQMDLNEDPVFLKLYNEVKPYTMTSIERCYGLYSAVNYIVNNNIQGNFVECGVWRGGSSMVILKTLMLHGVRDRKLYMYDTYEGMSAPTQLDGREANKEWKAAVVSDETNSWCLSKIDEVRQNMQSTGYDASLIELIKGKVEDTIPGVLPEKIALLRLDTDWYESTKHELLHLFPLLVQNGVLVIDDYGHWEGAKKAVDEYFAGNKNVWMHRLDYTGRLIIKNWQQ